MKEYRSYFITLLGPSLRLNRGKRDDFISLNDYTLPLSTVAMFVLL